jgi:HSP20 family protein
MISTSKDRLKNEPSSRTDVARRNPPAAGLFANGWDPFARFRDDFDWLLGRYFGAGPLPRERDPSFRGWDFDVRETEDAVVVEAEAPGFEPDDFDIEIRDDRLVLKAQSQSGTEGKDDGSRTWRRHELYRLVTLPATVDPDKVEASYRNGMLTITLPRTEKATRRRITVRG